MASRKPTKSAPRATKTRPATVTRITPAMRTMKALRETQAAFLKRLSAEGAAPEVGTIVYVHGIGNKPEASILKCQWDTALFGGPLGDRTRMSYWVNRERYPVPEAARAPGDTLGEGDGPGLRALGSTPAALADHARPAEGPRRPREAVGDEPRERRGGTGREGAAATRGPAPLDDEAPHENLSQGRARDFLYVPAERARMEASVTERLAGVGGPTDRHRPQPGIDGGL